MKKVLIVDDHPVVRLGLRDLLEGAPEIFRVDEACNGRAALKLAHQNKYDVILLDIQLPEQNGLELLSQFQEQSPNVPVLIISAYAEEKYALRAMRAGAAGYLAKDSYPDVFITAVRKVMAGGRYISPTLVEFMSLHFSEEGRGAPHDALSDREFEVLRLIGDGKTVSEIAADLSLSVKTISTYRARILQKLDLDNTSQMIRYAIKNNLAD